MTKADQELKEKLREMGLERCSNCGRELDRGDVAWSSGSTDPGTPYSYGEVICQSCDTELARWHSWSSEIEDFDDFVDRLLPDWTK